MLHRVEVGAPKRRKFVISHMRGTLPPPKRLRAFLRKALGLHQTCVTGDMGASWHSSL
jgi:hypothetical protein